MIYLILVQIIILLHLFFILFVPLGGLLTFRRKWWAIIHIPAFIWGVLISFGDWICPLTPLENWLRIKGGESGFQGGFIEHYLLPVIYPHTMTRGLQMTIGITVLILNLVVYGVLISRILRKKGMR